MSNTEQIVTNLLDVVKEAYQIGYSVGYTHSKEDFGSKAEKQSDPWQNDYAEWRIRDAMQISE